MKSYREIAGDGGSDILGQVGEQRRALAESLAGIERIVAVGSGKGGVGKSTLAFLLARSLMAEGSRVAILDADLNGPSQARMAGLVGRPWVPGENGLVLPARDDGLGVASLGSVLEEGEAMAFESPAVGDEHVWRSTREVTLLTQLVTAVDWGEPDVLVVDLPPGPERTAHLVPLFGPRLALILVTIPSALAHEVVARSWSALEDLPVSIPGYVENLAGYCCPGCHEIRPLFPEADVPLPPEVPCLGRVPFDPRVAEWCDRGWPEEDPESPALEAGRRLARELMDRLTEVA